MQNERQPLPVYHTITKNINMLINRQKISLAAYYIAFIITLTIFFVLLFINFYKYQKQTNTIKAIKYNINTLNKDVLLLKKDITLLFFDMDNNSTYLSEIENLNDKIDKDLKNLQSLITNLNIGTTNIPEIYDLLNQYKELLKKMQNDIFLYYNKENGLKITQEILYNQLILDTTFKKAGLVIFVKQINKIQNEAYKSGNLAEYNKKYNNLYKIILNHIKRHNTTQLISYTFLNKLSEYNSLFNKIFRVTMRILRKDQSTYFIVINKTIDQLILQIEQLKKSISYYKNIKYVNWLNISIIVILLLVIIQAIFLYRRLYLKWKDFHNTLNEFSKGNMQEVEIIKESKELYEVSKTTKMFVEYIKEKLNIIEKLADYNFDFEITKSSENDEFAKVLKKLKEKLLVKEKQTQQMLKREEIDKWMATGLTEMGRIMRQNTNNLDVFIDEVLKGIMGYTNGVQGAFFLYENKDNKEYLILKKAISYGKERKKDMKIELFEGLIGTAAAEKRFYFFDKVPENYTFIEDTFGKIPPQSLIIMPLVIENQLLGLIEISFIEKLENLKKEFFKRLSGEIAITLSYVKINQRTQELLEQTKKQAEKLQESENQYKLNQEELKKIIKSLENRLIKKEETIKNLEEFINQKILQISELKQKLQKKEEEFNKLIEAFNKEKQQLKKEIEKLTEQINKLQNKQ